MRVRLLLTVTALLVLSAGVLAPPAPVAEAQTGRPPVRLAFLGDSLTMGLHATTEDRMYREILARRILASAGGEVVATVIQDPYGLTDDAIRRMLPVLEARPDVVILEIGNHEAFAGPAEVAQFEGRYELLLGYLQMTGARVIASTLAWLNYPETSREYRQALRLNQSIRDLCARRGIAVADLWTPTVFRAELLSRPGEPSAISGQEGDLLHPNDAGHAVLADAFWDAYRRDLARRRLAALP
jgi:lysophospholipase L1-like esterase